MINPIMSLEIIYSLPWVSFPVEMLLAALGAGLIGIALMIMFIAADGERVVKMDVYNPPENKDKYA